MGESRGLSRRSPPPPSLPEAHTPSQRSAAHTQARWSPGQGTTPQAASGDRCRRKRQLWRTLSRPVRDADDLSSRYTLAELNSRQRLGTFLRVPRASRPPSPLVLTKSLSGGRVPGAFTPAISSGPHKKPEWGVSADATNARGHVRDRTLPAQHGAAGAAPAMVPPGPRCGRQCRPPPREPRPTLTRPPLSFFAKNQTRPL